MNRRELTGQKCPRCGDDVKTFVDVCNIVIAKWCEACGWRRICGRWRTSGRERLDNLAGWSRINECR